MLKNNMIVCLDTVRHQFKKANEKTVETLQDGYYITVQIWDSYPTDGITDGLSYSYKLTDEEMDYVKR